MDKLLRLAFKIVVWIIAYQMFVPLARAKNRSQFLWCFAGVVSIVLPIVGSSVLAIILARNSAPTPAEIREHLGDYDYVVWIGCAVAAFTSGLLRRKLASLPPVPLPNRNRIKARPSVKQPPKNSDSGGVSGSS